MTHRVGIIGLGVMGNNMRRMMSADDRFSVAAMADSDPAKLQALASDHPDTLMMPDSYTLISQAGLDLVYIATPPTSHIELASLVLERGLPVLCEKPLAVDIVEAEALVKQAEASGLPNAVNFPIASSSVMGMLSKAVKSGAIGDPLRIDIRCHFTQWPRHWQQAAAGWLAAPQEGGFVREVVSHFVHLTQALLGDNMTVRSSTVDYPDDQSSEDNVVALLDCGGVPVRLMGGVGGSAPDIVEWALYGSQKSYRFLNWRELQEGTTEGWTPVDLGTTPSGTMHMTAVSNLITGQPHPLADFAAGLKVQQTIEALLA